jgi:hypothetical protein
MYKNQRKPSSRELQQQQIENMSPLLPQDNIILSAIIMIIDNTALLGP